MDEYISRNALMRDLSESLIFSVRDGLIGEEIRGANKVIDRIKAAPVADVVEVVRCKDCRDCIDAHQDGFMYCMRPIEAEDYSETGYCYPLEVRTKIYDFCSYGKRKDGAE